MVRSRVTVCALAVLCCGGCDPGSQNSAPSLAKSSTVASSHDPVQNARSACQQQRNELLQEVEKLLSENRPWHAYKAVSPCNSLLEDEDLRNATQKAWIADQVKTLKDKSSRWEARLKAIRELRRLEPLRAEGYKKEFDQLVSREKREEKLLEQRVAASKKKEGVAIGMSQGDVLASSWGRPERIHKSVYSFGTHEQWVYGSGHYLYFENGKLASIQTSRQ